MSMKCRKVKLYSFLVFILLAMLLTNCTSGDINTKLLKSIKNRDVASCEKLLKKNADPNAKDIRKKYTALHLAISAESFDICQMLLDAGADPDLTSPYIGSPLSHCYKSNQIHIARLLLEKGADIEEKNTSGETFVLQEMLKEKRHEWIKLFVEYNADLNVKNHNLLSPLRLAVQNNDSLLTDLFLNSNSDINEADTLNGSLMWSALEKGNVVIAELLLDYGANIHNSNKMGNNLLMHELTNDARPEIVKFLIRNGIDVNQKNRDGMTALMIAALNRHPHAVQILIDNGAEVNDINGLNMTALMMTCIDMKKKTQKEYLNPEGNLESAVILVKSGADINKIDRLEFNALGYALLNNEVDLAVYLIRNGADVNTTIVDNRNNVYTALVWSARKVYFSNSFKYISKLLISKGADINTQCAKGTTALMEETRKGNFDMIYLLLENGADVSLRNDEDETALDIAKFYGKFDVINLLKEAEKDSTLFLQNN